METYIFQFTINTQYLPRELGFFIHLLPNNPAYKVET